VQYFANNTTPEAERFPLSLKAILFPLLLLLLFLTPLPSLAQQVIKKNTGEPDTTVVKVHSPGRAAIYSAVLPGLGQAYNKKYWKIPIVYAGFGVMSYFLVTNIGYYNDYQGAYVEKTNGNTTGKHADLVNRYTEDQLLSAREYYRRNLEMSVLVTAVWYSVNILDALVDAHLQTFDISEDLSLQVKPAAIPTPDQWKPATGISLTLKF